ncbi:MAG: hypothetical protein JWO82_3242, partial [Akkermansiaceae bacterium]|nr:hypothetical protein [Akkermansiaceae bacterium]
GSTNGIKLEGKKAEIIPLRHGLSVKVGDISFDFTLSDDERAALHREKPLEQSPIIKEDELEASEADGAGPRKAAAAVRVPTEVIYQNGTSPFVTFLMTVLFLALAGTAFFVGLSLRYSKDKGGASLLKAYKDANAAPAAVEAPAAPEAEAKKPE